MDCNCINNSKDTINAIPMVPAATNPTILFDRFFPKKPLIALPNKGSKIKTVNNIPIINS